jgi:hypothetical protein
MVAGVQLRAADAAALHSAAQRGKFDEVRRCLRTVAADARDHHSGESALHAVCSANHNALTERSRVAVTRLLLEHGADTHARGKYDWTPLHYACWRGHPELVTLLLHAGADPEARTARRTPTHLAAGVALTCGHTPRDYARDAGHGDCVAALDAHQAGVHFGLEAVSYNELGAGGGGRFKPAQIGKLPSGGGGRAGAGPAVRSRMIGHAAPCLNESHLTPPAAGAATGTMWGGGQLGRGVGGRALVLASGVGALLGGQGATETQARIDKAALARAATAAAPGPRTAGV